MALWATVPSRVQPLCHILARPCKESCAHCSHHHNLSVHVSDLIVRARVHGWPRLRMVASWRATAVRRDLRIIARLAIPQSLYVHLKCNLGAPRAARKASAEFQQCVYLVSHGITVHVAATTLPPALCFRPLALVRPMCPVPLTHPTSAPSPVQSDERPTAAFCMPSPSICLVSTLPPTAG